MIVLRRRQQQACITMLYALIVLFGSWDIAIAEETKESFREEYRPLLDLSSFTETGQETLLEGWRVFDGGPWSEEAGMLDADSWSLTTVEANTAVCLAGNASARVISPPRMLEEDLEALSASVTATGPGQAEVVLLWMRDEDIIHQVPFRAIPETPDGRRRFNLSESERPEGADTVRLMLATTGGAGVPFCWQTARITGLYRYRPEITILVNRVGYEQTMPKRFAVRANFLAENARFTLSDDMGALVYEGVLDRGQRIQGFGGAVWEDYYYPGDFSGFETEGDYELAVMLDDMDPVHVPITLRFNVLWERAFLPALLPFQQLRMPEDDGAESLHLWRDSGISAVSDGQLLWSLVNAWHLLRGRFPNDPPLLLLEQEVIYGVNRLAKWVLSHPAEALEKQSDYFWRLNALTCASRYLKEGGVLEAAKRLLELPLQERRPGLWFFFAAMDLHAATDEEAYLNYAKEIFPGIVLERVEPFLDFELLEEVALTPHIVQAFHEQAQPLVNTTDNPFNLMRPGRGFFVWEESSEHPLLGGNTRILSAVSLAAQAYRYTMQREFLLFVYDHLNWLMGNNPFGMCLVAGLCADAEPAVAPGMLPPERSAGAVLHGIGPREKDLDIPAFSVGRETLPGLYTNGFSLHNNAAYISAMAYLKRIPILRPPQ